MAPRPAPSPPGARRPRPRDRRPLTVLERAERDYLIVLVAGADEVVRAPPFDAVEIPVGEIFGEDAAGEEAEQG